MRLFLLVALTLTAFAANSVLNRLALLDGAAGPATFAAVRVGSGALALTVLARIAGQDMRLSSRRRLWSTLSLALYMLGFSFAYLTLDAGIGALILFGGVQITMFAGSLVLGDRPPAIRWAGMAIGFAGLAWLFWPTGALRIDAAGAVLMAGAAVGWGIYSLIGRGATAPLGETAGSFLCAVPVALAAWLFAGEGADATERGLVLAAISGVLTSGMGYALWYSVLPRMGASVAALAQLTVPIIAVAAGLLLLDEVVTLQAGLAGALVLGGVALGILGSSGRSARADHR